MTFITHIPVYYGKFVLNRKFKPLKKLNFHNSFLKHYGTVEKSCASSYTDNT